MVLEKLNIHIFLKKNMKLEPYHIPYTKIIQTALKFLMLNCKSPRTKYRENLIDIDHINNFLNMTPKLTKGNKSKTSQVERSGTTSS